MGNEKLAYTKRKTENSALKLLSDIVDCVVCFLITEFMDSVFLNFYAISSED